VKETEEERSEREMGTHQRREQIEEMLLDGQTVEEIASELDVPVRTVYRDREAIRKANITSRSPEAIERTIKGLCKRAQRTSERLRRHADKEGCPPRVRLRAEMGAWDVQMGLVKMLQSMGYLPDVRKK
jgi:DNA-binding CsgD family transcriptional regulator